MQPVKGSASGQFQAASDALTTISKTPFRCAKRASDWVGLSLISGDTFLLTPLDEIQYIFPVTPLAPISGVKPWIRGMLTTRTEIFPVTDLSGFITHTMTNITKDSRVLMIPTNEGYCGILIDAVINLHRIQKEHKISDKVPEIRKEYEPFIMGSIVLSRAELPIISFQTLVQDPLFKNIVRANNTEEKNRDESR